MLNWKGKNEATSGCRSYFPVILQFVSACQSHLNYLSFWVLFYKYDRSSAYKKKHVSDVTDQTPNVPNISCLNLKARSNGHNICHNILSTFVVSRWFDHPSQQCCDNIYFVLEMLRGQLLLPFDRAVVPV